jgi:hypothetical protein
MEQLKFGSMKPSKEAMDHAEQQGGRGPGIVYFFGAGTPPGAIKTASAANH